MLFRPRALPVLLRLFSSLVLVLLFIGSCSNKKVGETGEGSAQLQAVAENREPGLSNGASKGGLVDGGGDTEAGPEGVGGLKEGDKDEGGTDEDDAAFRMIVD